jgi:hypothetical protein
MNLIELLSKVPRDNTKFKGYEENPEYFDKLGERGVKIRNAPGFSDNQFTIGNTIFMPPGAGPNDKYVGGRSPNVWQHGVQEELGHVEQYRDMGLLGFAMKYFKELAKHKFNRKAMYDDSESLEGYHRDHDKYNDILSDWVD